MRRWKQSESTLVRGPSRAARMPRSAAAIATSLAVILTALLPVTSAAATPREISLADFEAGTNPWFVVASGAASGSLSVTTETPAQGVGAARLEADVPSGIVEVVRPVPSVELDRLGLSLRSTGLTHLGLRLTDSTGQVHQQVVALNPGTDWQRLTIDIFAGGAGYLHWGGANDGIWHGPLTQISLLVDSFRINPGPSVVVDFDEVIAYGAAAPLILTSTTIGNAFAAGEDVAIGLETAATTVSWTAKGSNGAVVASGESAPEELNGAISLGKLSVGWYTVTVLATQPDGSVVSGGTDISVLAPTDLRERRIGVAVHYGQSWDTATVPLIANASFGVARDEAFWADVEQVKGTYEFPAKVDAFSAAFEANDLNFLQVLSYGNSLYHEGEAPATDEGRTGYAGYAEASVDRFGTDDTTYEVWNEWNWRDLSGPAGGTAENYAAMLAAASDRILSEHPDATVVGPALAAMNDWQGWVDDFIAAGGLEDIDAFTTHPYNFTGQPEAFMDQVSVIRAKLSAAGHADMPIWLSEHGWHTATTPVGASEKVQARNLARAQLLALGEGLEKYIVYDLKDDGTNAAEPEHRFGIIRHESDPRGAYTPKPAYVAQAIVNRQTADRPVRELLSLGGGRYGVEFGARADEPAATRLQALWALEPQTWSVAASDEVIVTDLYGTQIALSPDETGLIHVAVGPEPTFVTGVLDAVTTSSPYSLTVSSAVAGQAPTATWRIANDTGADLTVALESDGGRTDASVASGQTTEVPALLAPSETGARTWTGVIRQGERAIGLVTTSATVVSALAITGSHALDAAGAEVLRLRLNNLSPAAVTVDALTWTVGNQSGVGLESATIPAQGTLIHDVPVTAHGEWAAAVAGPITATAHGVLTAASPTDVAFQPVRLDGKIDRKIATLPSLSLGEAEQTITGWGGPSDLSGRLWLTHDATSLYVTAEIIDDVQSQPARGAEIWRGDGVQVGAAAGWPGEATTTVNEIGAALTDDGRVEISRWLPVGASADGITAVVKRDESKKTTTYEMALAWTALGVDPTDRLLSTTIVVNENDGQVRRGWSSWGKGVAESKDPSKFQALRLMPAIVDTTVDLRVSVRSQCWGPLAVVALHAVNNESTPTDIRFITPLGEKEFTKIAPGKAVYYTFFGKKGKTDAGQAVNVGTTRDQSVATQRYTVDYEAVTCR